MYVACVPSCFEARDLHVALLVILGGIYLLSKHGEEEDVASATLEASSSRAHLTSGHFGALMPLSPSHRGSSSMLIPHRKASGYEDRDEKTPLCKDAMPFASPPPQQQQRIEV